ncbi:hypothetical protein G8A07_14380 [Roseateles sp. DAIF2]|uniref:pentapeptide repeat-containing protein n=1 Tax=Roseateles sp. DAIF2 TaxID=2714952 RepID=UPI0018A2D2A2|nr:hypothetical protein [Roseateles sp. DAIF2]QPF73985.1 hypothetical protein G8A07_14380 [Roseateles sp. DAIF2]
MEGLIARYLVAVNLFAAPTLWAATPAALQGETRPCPASPGTRKPVQAADVLKDIRSGKPVSLDGVSIMGDLDLSLLPLESVVPKGESKLPGLPSLKDDLKLAQLERELATNVRNVLLVRAAIAIENSEIYGRINIGPANTPVVFLSTFALRNTRVCGDVDLSRVRFRNPVIFDGSTFNGQLTLRHAVFGGNALLRKVKVDARTDFGDARFERSALFSEFLVGNAGSLSFSRAKFAAGLDFHAEEQGGTVLKALSFADAVVDGSAANFEKVVFRGANFNNASLNASAKFSEARFDGERGNFTGVSFRGGVDFDGAIFPSGAIFFNAEFVGERPASFDRTNSRRSMDFTKARLAGPVSFVQSEIAGLVSFEDAEVRSSLDFRLSRVHALKLGGGSARVKLVSEALFDHAWIGKALFDNTDFAGKASFVSTNFGWSGTCPEDSERQGIALSLEGASFATTADFAEARFMGRLSMRNLGGEAGNLRWRWVQIAKALTAGTGAKLRELEKTPGCYVIETRAQTDEEKWGANAETLRSLERNFSSLDLLDDANAVAYLRETAEARQEMGDARLTWSERALAAVRLYGFGYLGGYGVKPLRILGEIALLVMVGSLVYGRSGRTLGCDPPSDTPLDWKLIALPIKDKTWFGSTTVPRWLLAAWVSIAATTTIRTRAAYICLGHDDRMRWVVYVQRAVGYLLVIVLGISVGRTMPFLQKTLGGLPGF